MEDETVMNIHQIDVAVYNAAQDAYAEYDFHTEIRSIRYPEDTLVITTPKAPTYEFQVNICEDDEQTAFGGSYIKEDGALVAIENDYAYCTDENAYNLGRYILYDAATDLQCVQGSDTI